MWNEFLEEENEFGDIWSLVFQQDVFVDICPVGSWIFSAHTQERGQG